MLHESGAWKSGDGALPARVRAKRASTRALSLDAEATRRWTRTLRSGVSDSVDFRLDLDAAETASLVRLLAERRRSDPVESATPAFVAADDDDAAWETVTSGKRSGGRRNNGSASNGASTERRRGGFANPNGGSGNEGSVAVAGEVAEVIESATVSEPAAPPKAPKGWAAILTGRASSATLTPSEAAAKAAEEAAEEAKRAKAAAEAEAAARAEEDRERRAAREQRASASARRRRRSRRRLPRLSRPPRLSGSPRPPLPPPLPPPPRRRRVRRIFSRRRREHKRREAVLRVGVRGVREDARPREGGLEDARRGKARRRAVPHRHRHPRRRGRCEEGGFDDGDALGIPARDSGADQEAPGRVQARDGAGGTLRRRGAGGAPGASQGVDRMGGRGASPKVDLKAEMQAAEATRAPRRPRRSSGRRTRRRPEARGATPTTRRAPRTPARRKVEKPRATSRLGTNRHRPRGRAPASVVGHSPPRRLRRRRRRRCRRRRTRPRVPSSPRPRRPTRPPSRSWTTPLRR